MATPQEIERLRKSKTDFTQEEFARELGMSKSTYSRIVHGEAEITVNTLRRIAEVTKTDYNELVTTSPPKVEENEIEGFLPAGTAITVVLDGTTNTLKKWIKRLESINDALAT